ncbi:DUF4355 domain-containing protein [uncultured Limosilactobacillus sp.]|uniref:DUF4355 domain-containing protein n=1 Tax=uncultured Limosilactobacillus sp. TaxID=2837629 RepID=UPI0025CD2989|nr:DUF4355 domain-containing protein [uncultured Limosilactobacillus sp.]
MDNNEGLQNQEQEQQATDQGNNEQQDQEQSSKVTFTDDQQRLFDQKLSETIAKERDRADRLLKDAQKQAEQDKQDAIQKAQERAKMTAEERAKAEQQDREKAYQDKQSRLNQQLREVETKNMLIDKGISLDMLPLLMGADDDATQSNIDRLNKYVDQKVQAATEKLLQGKSNPTNGNGSVTTSIGNNPWSKDGWNLTKQQQIVNSNPEQARQLIAQAQPTGYFIQ